MHIPLNVLQYYIGLPILAGLTIDLSRRNRLRKNPSSQLLCLATFSSTIALAGFGLPALFTQQTSLLSIGSFIGDFGTTMTMLFLWLLCLRAFLASRPLVHFVAKLLVTILTIVSVVEIIRRNLMPPDSTSIIYTNSGAVALKYSDTVAYHILSGLDSLALVLTGFYFWRQAQLAPAFGQRIRIRSLALSFGFIAASFITVGVFPLESQPTVAAILFGSGFATVGLGLAAGKLIK